MYQAMSTRGAPISFQTAAAARVGSITETLALAANLGASSVELPAGYQDETADALGGAVGRLLRNAKGG
jgi:hypothetical protein